MRKFNFKQYTALVLLTLAMFSCKREDPESIYSGRKLAPADFQLTSGLTAFSYSEDAPGNTLIPDGGIIRFNQDSMFFAASFSHEVSWYIVVTGQTSGAKKYFYGDGTSIGSVETLWYGGHNDMIFFRQGENAQAVLRFYGTTVADTITFTIQSAREYGALEDHYLVLNSEVTNGFESAPTYPQFFGFDENGSTIGITTEIPNTPQGRLANATAMRINGNPADDIFLNGARYGALNNRPGGAGDWNAGNAILLTNDDFDGSGDYISDPRKEDATQVWVNVYVYIPFVDFSKYMEIQLKESDDNGKNLSYTDEDDDAWVHRVPYDKQGWKFVSFPYSDTWASPARNFGGNGNKVREPHRCIGFQCNLYSQALGEASWIAIDYPIFTIGGPFDPSK